MLSQDFLLEYGLYRRFNISVDEAQRADLLNTYHGPSIHRHCDTCRRETTWNQCDLFRPVEVSNPHFSNLRDSFNAYAQTLRQPNSGQPRAPEPVAENTFRVKYRCDACKRNEFVCIVQYVMTLESYDTWPPILGLYAKKVGQWPPPTVDLPKDLAEWLADHADAYKKGRVLENQGYGLGAFAYYRRIVEDTIASLLDEITDVFTNDVSKQAYVAKLDEVRKTSVHATKIEIVKDLIPDELRKDSRNPLGLLHSALSVGLHAMSEEECLEVAVAIRETLVRLKRHLLSTTLERKDNWPQHEKAIQAKLDKIKARP